MADEEPNPFLAMDFSDEESEAQAQAKTKVPRDFQSEADFLQTRKQYVIKVEDGSLYKHLPDLPTTTLPSKPVSQAILHAIEELYFYRRYEEALDIAERALAGELDPEFRKTVEGYKGRCLGKLGR